MADTTAPEIDKCKTCNQPAAEGQALKRCGRCKSVLYCSRDCQKADWKLHNTLCASQAQSNAENNADTTLGNQRGAPRGANTPGASRVLEMELENLFDKLFAGTWLHDRPEKDVYKLLIDTYRMRVEDNYCFKGDIDMDSIYGEATDDGESGFRRFLRLVEMQRELLPSWWSPVKANECVALGLSRSEWSCLAYAVEKSDIIEHYGHFMHKQLRMFGEQVYGTPPA
ncbi:uncharacterized protein N7496_008748 [Penicillium cataractarum]|uniref:MYND-type domain-containing protein n=1 Tax=Penicillium cataractarum TaxID=2100454 RepID=A0A9W9RZ12_9EURO|nr:uncharacterized protein N7496_008748 [Penicillium cataractarum]KAJ5368988.1 hypothetical protein N7496_008748 [Penicillium cataractarum]